NVAKHANSDSAIVALRVDEQNRLCIEVQDRGRGFNPEADRQAGGHFGLFSVKERMEALGGRLDVRSAPGQGTTGTLLVPLSGQCEQRKEPGNTEERRQAEMLNAGKQN